MKFGPAAPQDSAGAILAHAVYLPDGRIRKGTRLGDADIARLTAFAIQLIQYSFMTSATRRPAVQGSDPNRRCIHSQSGVYTI